VKGKRFTLQTTPAGAWDGIIRCQVLDVVTKTNVAYAWKGGHESNVAYGSQPDAVGTFTVSKLVEGTRVRVVHSGRRQER
jgi:hypothetical protein